jgi:hypothetical protein
VRLLVDEHYADEIAVELRAAVATSGRDHGGLLLTSDISMPRHKGTIGVYVRTLRAIMEANRCAKYQLLSRAAFDCSKAVPVLHALRRCRVRGQTVALWAFARDLNGLATARLASPFHSRRRTTDWFSSAVEVLRPGLSGATAYLDFQGPCRPLGSRDRP